jgi:CubicO group peptidase (beta-lactamase class C family)
MSHSGGFFPERRILAKETAEEIGAFDPEGEDITYSEALAAEGVTRVAARLDGRVRLIGRPGELMSYSNDCYGLLSDIIRRFGGEGSYSRYVVKHVLEPLEMTRSHLEFEKTKFDENCTRLYIHQNGRRETGDFYDNAFVLMGGGALRSTVDDMKKYVRMLINEGAGENGVRILGRYYVREMKKPAQFYRHQQYYGYGLSIRFMDDITIIGHGGGMTGISNMMCFSPELEAGVNVFCNTTDVPVSEIALAAMRLLNGKAGKKPRWEPEFTDTPWTKKTIGDALGLYKSDEGSTFEVYEKAGGVGLRLDGEEKTIRTVGGETLLIAAPHTQADFILCRGSDGGVIGARHGGRIIPKIPRQEA